MSILSKIQPLIIICSALCGLLLGIFTPLSEVSMSVVELFLMLLLYILFLSINMSEVTESAKNMKYTLASISVNFVITPIIAYILGLVFFETSLEIRIGLLMLLTTPCTDWYLVFTKLSKGNVEINMAILPLNLLLQVALMPVYLLVFLGNSISLDFYSLLENMLFVLCIPFICALCTRFLIKNSQRMEDMISNRSDALQLLFLCLAVLIMFASEGKNLLLNYVLLAKLFLPLLCFFVFTFYLVQALNKVWHFTQEDLASLHLTTLARNSPLALAIAVSTFPTEPIISLALIIGPLIELPILSVVAGVLRKRNST